MIEVAGSKASRSRGRAILPIAIVLIVIAATFVVAHDRGGTPASKPSVGAVESAPLPVVPCPTRVGADIGRHVAMPKVLHESVARDLTSTTAVFVDQYDAMRMGAQELVMRGQHCGRRRRFADDLSSRDGIAEIL